MKAHHELAVGSKISHFSPMRAPDKKTLIREVARWLVELNHEPVAFRWPGSSQEIARVLCIDV